MSNPISCGKHSAFLPETFSQNALLGHDDIGFKEKQRQSPELPWIAKVSMIRVVSEDEIGEIQEYRDPPCQTTR